MVQAENDGFDWNRTEWNSSELRFSRFYCEHHGQKSTAKRERHSQKRRSSNGCLCKNVLQRLDIFPSNVGHAFKMKINFLTYIYALSITADWRTDTLRSFICSAFLHPTMYKPHVARMHHASLLTSRVSLSHATPKTLWIAPGIKSGKVLSIEAIDLAFVFFTARQLYLLHSLWRFFCADFRASQCERFDFIILELHPFFCYLWFPRLQFWNALFGMVRCYVFAVGGIFLLLKSAQFHGFYVMPFSNLTGKRYNFFTYN